MWGPQQRLTRGSHGWGRGVLARGVLPSSRGVPGGVPSPLQAAGPLLACQPLLSIRGSHLCSQLGGQEGASAVLPGRLSCLQGLLVLLGRLCGQVLRLQTNW